MFDLREEVVDPQNLSITFHMSIKISQIQFQKHKNFDPSAPAFYSSQILFLLKNNLQVESENCNHLHVSKRYRKYLSIQFYLLN